MHFKTKWLISVKSEEMYTVVVEYLKSKGYEWVAGNKTNPDFYKINKIGNFPVGYGPKNKLYYGYESETYKEVITFAAETDFGRMIEFFNKEEVFYKIGDKFVDSRNNNSIWILAYCGIEQANLISINTGARWTGRTFMVRDFCKISQEEFKGFFGESFDLIENCKALTVDNLKN